jgi:cytochrome c oxidase subunit 1
MAYLVWSMRYGSVTSSNPWAAKGLEWQIPSPPPTENFEQQPVVHEEAYHYAPDLVVHGAHGAVTHG